MPIQSNTFKTCGVTVIPTFCFSRFEMKKEDSMNMNWFASFYWRRSVWRGFLFAAGCFLAVTANVSQPLADEQDGKGSDGSPSAQAVLAEREGSVSNVLVAHGDRVRKGQVLFRLTPRETETAIRLMDITVRDAGRAVKHAQLRGDESDIRLRAQALQVVEQMREAISRQAKLLEIRSPADGVIVMPKIMYDVPQGFRGHTHVYGGGPPHPLHRAVSAGDLLGIVIPDARGADALFDKFFRGRSEEFAKNIRITIN
jgi:hypothetical protein